MCFILHRVSLCAALLLPLASFAREPVAKFFLGTNVQVGLAQASPQGVVITSFGDTFPYICTANREGTVTIIAYTNAAYRVLTNLSLSPILRADIWPSALAAVSGRLAVANLLDNTVSIITRSTNGIFQVVTNLPTGQHPVAIAAADVKARTATTPVLRFVTANNYNDTITSIGFDNSRRIYFVETNYSARPFPQTIALADVTGDGWPDIITASGGDNSLTVLMGNGTGRFDAFGTGIVSSNAGRSVLSMAIPFLGNANQTITVLRNNSVGNFTTVTNLPFPHLPTTMATGDLNDDGILDLVAAYGEQNTNMIAVFLGTGDSRIFAPPIELAVGGMPSALVVGDFFPGLMYGRNPDIAVVTSDTSEAFMILNHNLPLLKFATLPDQLVLSWKNNAFLTWPTVVVGVIVESSSDLVRWQRVTNAIISNPPTPDVHVPRGLGNKYFRLSK